MRSVMSSMRMMRPTVRKSRVTSGAMAMLAMRVSPRGQREAELVEGVGAVGGSLTRRTLSKRATNSGGRRRRGAGAGLRRAAWRT